MKGMSANIRENRLNSFLVQCITQQKMSKNVLLTLPSSYKMLFIYFYNTIRITFLSAAILQLKVLQTVSSFIIWVRFNEKFVNCILTNSF